MSSFYIQLENLNRCQRIVMKDLEVLKKDQRVSEKDLSVLEKDLGLFSKTFRPIYFTCSSYFCILLISFHANALCSNRLTS